MQLSLGDEMKLRNKAFAVVATAAAMVVGFATTASAGTNATSSTNGSFARFIHKGEKFESCDTASDGGTSYVQYEYVRVNGTLQKGEHRNPGSEGDCFTWDHNFGEGRTVKFRACNAHTAWPDNCDAWRKGVA
jgi:hypothetical protein